MKKLKLRALSLAMMMVPALAMPATAETKEVRIGQSFGMSALATYVVLEKKLIEKHAAELGMPDVEASLVRTIGGAQGIDLLLTKGVDLAVGAVTQMMVAREKTRGAQKIKGVMALSDGPIVLMSVDPEIKTLADYDLNDRIAMPGPKTSVPAIELRMIAEKQMGPGAGKIFDTLEVSVPSPDAAAMMISGGTEIKSYASTLPFSVIIKEEGNAHQVFNSFDELGPINIAIMFSTQGFIDENPTVYKAILAAYEEAFEFIENDKAGTAEVYLSVEPQTRGIDWVVKTISDPNNVMYTMEPHNIMMFANYMYEKGMLKEKVDSWKDFFFEGIHHLDGS